MENSQQVHEKWPIYSNGVCSVFHLKVPTIFIKFIVDRQTIVLFLLIKCIPTGFTNDFERMLMEVNVFGQHFYSNFFHLMWS